MTGRHKCDACGHEQERDQLLGAAGPRGALLYCTDRAACKERTKLMYIRNYPNKETQVTLPQHSRFNWDNPEFRTSAYFKWEKPGDNVTGTITAIGTYTFEAKTMPDGTTSPAKTVPTLTITDDNGAATDVTCSNADLLEQIRAVGPQVGDRIRMEYLREITTSFGGKKKLFSVKHQPATQAAHAQTLDADAPF